MSTVPSTCQHRTQISLTSFFHSLLLLVLKHSLSVNPLFGLTLITRNFGCKNFGHEIIGRLIFGRFFSKFWTKFLTKSQNAFFLFLIVISNKTPRGTLTIEADRGVPSKRVLFFYSSRV